MLVGVGVGVKSGRPAPSLTLNIKLFTTVWHSPDVTKTPPDLLNKVCIAKILFVVTPDEYKKPPQPPIETG